MPYQKGRMEDAVRHTVVRVRSDNGSTRSMAKNGGTTRAEIQSCCSGERDLYAGTFCRLANYYATAYGDLRLANLAVPEEYAVVPAAPGEANGRIEDEMDRLMQAAGRLSSAWHEKDVPTQEEAFRALQKAVSDVEAEIKNQKADLR